MAAPSFDRKRLITIGCLAILYLVWGSTYLAMRVAVRGFAPMQLGAIRFALAGGLLFVALRLRGVATPAPREWARSGMIGALMMVAGLGSTAYAVQSVSSGVCALVFGCVPLFTALFQRAFGQALRKREVVGLALGFSGVALVATHGSLVATPFAAAVLVFGASAYSLGCTLASRVPQVKGPMAAAMQMLVAGAGLFVLSVLRGESWPARLELLPCLALAHLVVLGSIVGYCVLLHLLRTERPALATSYAFVNPFVALGLGALILGEHVGRAEIAGLALVLSAVWLVVRRPAREESPAPAVWSRWRLQDGRQSRHGG